MVKIEHQTNCDYFVRYAHPTKKSAKIQVGMTIFLIVGFAEQTKQSVYIDRFFLTASRLPLMRGAGATGAWGVEKVGLNQCNFFNPKTSANSYLYK